MAKLRLEDGREITDLGTIVDALTPLGLSLSSEPVGDAPALIALLAKPSLDAHDKAQVLGEIDPESKLGGPGQWQARDLVTLHPETPKIDELLATFARCHVHSDDEIRFIIDGAGVFGVVLPDGGQVELTVEAPEYIRVPAGTEHWFRLTSAKRCKAIRYFSETPKWEADFTGTQIRFPLTSGAAS